MTTLNEVRPNDIINIDFIGKPEFTPKPKKKRPKKNKKTQRPPKPFTNQEDAALAIQSAWRAYRVRK